MVAPEGVAPSLQVYETCVLTAGPKSNMAPGSGLEPLTAESESAVLPLHQSLISAGDLKGG